MDTKTGEIIQVVETGARADQLREVAHISEGIMTQAQVVEVNAKREAAGEHKIEPIAKMPKPNCRRCYGLGHLGKDIKSGKYIKCVCVLNDDEAKARRANIAKNELDHRMHGRK